MLDFDRVQAQLLLEKDKERAEWLTLEPDPPAAAADSEYTCDGSAQFLVDVCLGRETVNCAPLDLGVRTVAVMEAAWQSAHSGRARPGRGARRTAERRLRAGAARLSLEPPLDLPLVGFVRQTARRDRLRPLRARDLRDRARAGRPPGRPLRRRHRRHRRAGDLRAARPGRRRRPAPTRPGSSLNWNHTHLSVIGGSWGGELRRAARARSATRGSGAFADVVQDKVVSVCALACERLEPARPGVGRRVRRARRQPARARAGRDDDPRLEPRRPRRQPGHLAPVPPPRRERRRDRGQLRLPPGHDRLRHVRLLGRLPGPAARRRAARTRAARPSSSRARAATSCRRSRSPTTRARPS